MILFINGLILSINAQQQESPKIRNQTIDNRLFDAIEKEDLNAIAQAIQDEADINAQKDNKTALMWAIESKNNFILMLLLHLGADVNKKADNGESPLLFAAIHNPTAIKILKDWGNEITVPEEYADYPSYLNDIRAKAQESYNQLFEEFELLEPETS